MGKKRPRRQRQFGLVEVWFRGLARNTAHAVTLFALSNLWMTRKQRDSAGAVIPADACKTEESSPRRAHQLSRT